MKKYIVKYKDVKKTFGEFSSREEASKKIMEYINDCNEDLDEDFVSPFDFTLEEVECKDVNEVITDFESARKDLGGKPNILSGNVVQLNDVSRLVTDINPMHIEALIALNELFTIAQAWNKEDGFVPDFSNVNQCKYFPWFIYNNDAAGFVCAATYSTPTTASAFIGSRLCFNTSERAAQFGKQFIHLYNKVFLQK